MFLNQFKSALEKKRNKGVISYSLNHNVNVSEEQIMTLLGENIPSNVKVMLMDFGAFKIDKPRSFELLEFSDLKIIRERFLLFAIINDVENICFDMRKINSANEWDIINIKDEFIITHTLSSFFTNKVWAWIDRSRTIWKEEIYG